MLLDLKNIIRAPGTQTFDFELDLSEFDFVSVQSWLNPLRVSGTVKSSADVLTLTADVASDALVTCDRCGETFERHTTQVFTATLAENLQDEDNPDIFPVKGGIADLDDVIRSLYILDLPSQLLCNQCNNE